MSKYYKINVKLSDSTKELYINKDKIIKFVTTEKTINDKQVYTLHITVNHKRGEEGYLEYESTYDNSQDLIKEVNKILL